MDVSSIDQKLLAIIGLVVLACGFVSTALIIVFSVMHPASPARLTNTIKQRSWRGKEVALLLLGFIGLALLLSLIMPLFEHSDNPASQLIPVLIFSASQLMLILLIGRDRQKGWSEDFGMQTRGLKWLPAAVPVYLAMLPVLGIVTNLYHKILIQYFGIDVDLQEAVQLISQSRSWTKAGYIILAVGIAPLYEEMIFRGVFFSYLTRRAGLPGAIVAVSLIFALIHFHIPSMIPLFLLSAVLCLTYWRTGSLWANIGLHALFNGVTVLFVLWMS